MNEHAYEIPSLITNLAQNSLNPLRQRTKMPIKTHKPSNYNRQFQEEISQKNPINTNKTKKPLLKFKLLYFDRQTSQFKKQIVRARSTPAVVFRYSYYTTGGYERRSRSQIRYPPCRVCGARKPCKGGNTTQMLRHLRTSHYQLEKLLNQKFEEGDKSKCYFINLCEYSEITQMGWAQANHKQETKKKNRRDSESSDQWFADGQIDQNSRYLYKFGKNPLPIKPHEKITRPLYEHEKGIFESFPQNSEQLSFQASKIYAKKSQKLQIQPKNKSIKNTQISQKYFEQIRSEQKDDQHSEEYYMQEQRKYSALDTFHNPGQNIEIIVCRNFKGEIAGRIHYNIKKVRFPDQLNSLFIYYVSAQCFSKSTDQSLICLCSQNQAGQPIIIAALQLTTWIHDNQIQSIFIELFKVFPQQIWPQIVFFCGHNQQIKNNIQKVLKESQSQQNSNKNIQQLQPTTIHHKLYQIPQQILHLKLNSALKIRCLKIYNQLKQQLKNKISFYGFLFTPYYFSEIQVIISRSYYQENFKNTIKQLFSYDNRKIKLESSNNQLALYALDNPSTGKIIMQIYSQIFDKDLKQLQSWVYPKIYRKFAYFYIYAKYSLIASKVWNQSNTYLVTECLKKNIWRNKLQYRVSYNNNDNILQCECSMGKILGLPCSHIMRIILESNPLQYIKQYIHPQWIIIENSSKLATQLELLYKIHKQKIPNPNKKTSETQIHTKKTGLTLKQKDQPQKILLKNELTKQNFYRYGLMSEHLLQKLLFWV